MKSIYYPKKNLNKVFPNKNGRIYDFLKNRQTAVLATVDQNSSPNTAVIYYSINNSFELNFMTKAKTAKNLNLSLDPRVSLAVFDETTQTTVNITGKAIELTDPDETHKIFRNGLRASLRSTGIGIPPISKLDAGNHVFYRVIPDMVRMAVYTRPGSGIYKQMFETANIPTA